VFARRVTPEDADEDLARLALLNTKHAASIALAVHALAAASDVDVRDVAALSLA
jgi:hypothetical protein